MSFQAGKDLREFEFEFEKAIDNHETVREKQNPFECFIMWVKVHLNEYEFIRLPI